MRFQLLPSQTTFNGALWSVASQDESVKECCQPHWPVIKSVIMRSVVVVWKWKVGIILWRTRNKTKVGEFESVQLLFLRTPDCNGCLSTCGQNANLHFLRLSTDLCCGWGYQHLQPFDISIFSPSQKSESSSDRLVAYPLFSSPPCPHRVQMLVINAKPRRIHLDEWPP